MKLPTKTMTADEFKAARATLGLSAAAMADALLLGTDGGKTVRRWESGESAVSGPVTLAVALLVKANRK